MMPGLLLVTLLAVQNPYGPTGACMDLTVPMVAGHHYVNAKGCIVWTLGEAYTQRDQRVMLIAETIDREACGGVDLLTFIPGVVPVGWRQVQGTNARFCYPARVTGPRGPLGTGATAPVVLEARGPVEVSG